MPITTRATSAPADLVEIGPGLVMPRTAVVEARGMQDPALDVDVHVEVVDGVLVAQRVDVRAAGVPVTSEALRAVPVASLARHAASLAGRVVSVAADGATVVEDAGVGDEDVEYVRTHGEDEHALRVVATTYSLARAMGRPPVRLVEEWLHLSRATAGRRIAAARARGLLPAAEGPGRAGAQPRTYWVELLTETTEEERAGQVDGHGG